MDIFEIERAVLRLKEIVNVKTDKDVASLLGMDVSAFNKRKQRSSFPERELSALAEARPELGIDTQYVLTGRATHMAFGTAKQIGIRLRNERLRINWGDAEMARHLGCTLADYVALEDGLRAPSAPEVMALRAHDALDAELVLGGASLKRPAWELDEDEAELVTNYRASHEEGRARIRQTAANSPKRSELKEKKSKPKVQIGVVHGHQIDLKGDGITIAGHTYYAGPPPPDTGKTTT